MVAILTMQNKDFSGDTEEPNEVPGADEETKSHLHWQFLGIWQNPLKNNPGIIVRQRHTDRKHMGLLREQCAEWKRDICSFVAMRSGQWMVGGFHGMLLLSAKYSRYFSFGKRPYEWRFGVPFNGPVIPFGAMVEYHPISARDQSRLHQFGTKVLPGMFLGYALHAGRTWKGDMLTADIEELEQMDACEIHAWRLNAKEVSTPMKGDKNIFPIADGTVKICGGDQRLRTATLIWDRPERGEEQEMLQGESGGLSSPPPPQDDSTLEDAEAKNDFWTITGDFILSPSRGTPSQLYMPREESFPVPLKYIDVTRNTHVTGCIVGEKYWWITGT